MKKPFLLLALAMLLGTSVWAQCTSGPYPDESPSPDAYGYTWKSEAAAGGPAYTWFDISGTGTVATGVTDDNFVGPITLPFNFPYFINAYNQIYIGSNGYIMFGTSPVNIASGASGFPVFPSPGSPASGNNFIGALLTDLTLTDVDGVPVPNAQVIYGEYQDSFFVITYKNVPYWTDDNARHWQGRNTFQIILHEGGNITLNYQSVDDSVHSSYVGLNFITRGYEDITGQNGACLPSNLYPADNSTIRIYRPGSSSFVSTDGGVEWVGALGNLGSTYLKGDNITTLDVGVRNTGTTTLTSVQAQLRVFDLFNNNTQLGSQVKTIASIAPGSVATESFNITIPTNKVGQYSLVAEINASGDNFISNNSLTGEVSVVDTVNAFGSDLVYLGHDRFMWADFYGVPYIGPGTPGITPWTLASLGGSDGISANLETGVYFEPPYYPATVKEINLNMFFQNPTTQVPNPVYTGYRIHMFSDNNGVPGTLLLDTLIDVADLAYPPNFQPVEQSLQTIALTPSQEYNIPDGGGVFVSYVVPNVPDTIYNAMVTDEDPGSPASYRTYEVTGNSWSFYRDRPNADFALRVGVSKPDSSVSRNVALAQYVRLGQNQPNPAGTETLIPFSLKQPGQTSLEVRNLMGQLVMEQNLGNLPAGAYTQRLNLTTFAPGMYTYTLSVNGQRITRRMIVGQ